MPKCENGVDDDGDGKVDWPADPGCTDGADNDEYNSPPPPPRRQCSDGVDNDGDGKIDYPNDPGCTGTADNDEYNAPPPPRRYRSARTASTTTATARSTGPPTQAAPTAPTTTNTTHHRRRRRLRSAATASTTTATARPTTWPIPAALTITTRTRRTLHRHRLTIRRPPNPKYYEGTLEPEPTPAGSLLVTVPRVGCASVSDGQHRRRPFRTIWTNLIKVSEFCWNGTTITRLDGVFNYVYMNQPPFPFSTYQQIRYTEEVGLIPGFAGGALTVITVTGRFEYCGIGFVCLPIGNSHIRMVLDAKGGATCYTTGRPQAHRVCAVDSAVVNGGGIARRRTPWGFVNRGSTRSNAGAARRRLE